MSRVIPVILAALVCSPSTSWAAGPAAGSATFDQRYQLYGIAFRVTCPNATPTTVVTVTPSKLAVDNSAVTQEIDGRVVGATVADLDRDRSPEIYVVVRSRDARARASLVAFSANRRKSLSTITLPPLEDDAALAAGYRGHDDFLIERGALVRRFPVYKDGDPDDRPTGGTRRVRYVLKPGEAGWLLRPLPLS